MKLSQLFLTSSLLLSFATSLFSAETDHFTRRDEPLLDSAELINSKANKSLLKALQTSNKKGYGCNEEKLYEELRVYFRNHLSGKFTKDVIADSNVQKRIVNIPDSVYQDWNLWDGVGMGLTVIADKGVTMSGLIRVGDQYIGVDKLEHMFGQGFKYFKQNYLKGKGVKKAVTGGIFREKFILGGFKIGNGVFSYGDLGANFNGMRFWNHMLSSHPDILGPEHDYGPYVKCSEGKWVQGKEIDFRNYVDDSMDESINCAKYPTKKTANKFKKRLASMGMSCPMDQQRLDDLKVKYGKMAKWIINSDGSGKVKYFSEFRGK